MKKLILLMLLPFVMKAQKITENKKDDMTGDQITRTSKERITGGMSSNWIKAGVDKFNGYHFLRLTVGMSGSFFIVNKDSELIVKLSNDSTVTLRSVSRETASDGMGGKQADLGYDLNNYLELLKKNDIKKMRIYTTDGYTDFEVPDKNKSVIRKELELIGSVK